jgi:ABC-2 type transport system permease protein
VIEVTLKGLWQLTWLEVKIFVREPLGVFGTVGVPVLLFVLLGRMLGAGSRGAPRAVRVEVPVASAILITLSAIMSLVTIVAIYREGGILKRLRATPLRPHTILTAHVLVKLFFTAVTMALMALVGRRYLPIDAGVPLGRFGVALLVSTFSLLSIGFVIASLVPTARFAQPIATILLYPMVGLSGLFVPIESLPPALHTLSRLIPFTYAVSLLKGMWLGDPWSAHLYDVAALAIVFALSTIVSAKVFRWD